MIYDVSVPSTPIHVLCFPAPLKLQAGVTVAFVSIVFSVTLLPLWQQTISDSQATKISELIKCIAFLKLKKYSLQAKTENDIVLSITKENDWKMRTQFLFRNVGRRKGQFLKLILPSYSLRKFKKKLQYKQFLVSDEISMVSSRTLLNMHRTLYSIKASMKPFGIC